ncbi:MAG: tetratricopeptide repeat protein, partial [Rhodanobacteraceae bacterium]
MERFTSRAVSLVAGLATLGLVFAATASAQTTASHAATVTAPDYGSGASAGALSDSNFNTPESDGRPGVKFFTYGVQAFRKGDYAHAIDMYKVAASW